MRGLVEMYARAHALRKWQTGATARFDLCKIRILHGSNVADIVCVLFSGLQVLLGRVMG